MHRAVSTSIAFLAIASLGGCESSKSITQPDVDSSTAPGPDVAASPDGAVSPTPSPPDTGAEDTAPDMSATEAAHDAPSEALNAPPLTAYAITAKLVRSIPDGGPPRPTTGGLPATHSFTLLIDWKNNTAAAGSGGTGAKVPLVQKDGIWTTQGHQAISFSPSPTGETRVGGLPVVDYKEIVIRPIEGGCAGHATGGYRWNISDMLFNDPFEAELSGVTDTTGPAFSLIPKADTNLHPLDSSGVAVSELMAPGTTARWVASDGTVVPLSALPTNSPVGVSGFVVANSALAFATIYHLEVLPSAEDLAGNLTTKLPSLATMAGPGLFAQDGFEGAIDALFGGKVKAVDDTSFAVPTGHKAIRFAPSGLFGSSGYTETSCEDRFTARLAVVATSKSVKFSVLEYSPKGALSAPPFFSRLSLARPNGAVSETSYWMPTGGKPLPSQWTGTLPGSDQWRYGSPIQIEVALPTGTGGEVIFDVYRPCYEPSLGSNGMLLDDVRVE